MSLQALQGGWTNPWDTVQRFEGTERAVLLTIAHDPAGQSGPDLGQSLDLLNRSTIEIDPFIRPEGPRGLYRAIPVSGR